jgi:hypothetical protein
MESKLPGLGYRQEGGVRPLFEKNQEIKNKFDRLLSSVSDEIFLEIEKKTANFTSKIEGEISDARAYRLFHFLIHSTPDIDIKYKEDDFFGDLSIEKFVNDLVVEYEM